MECSVAARRTLENRSDSAFACASLASSERAVQKSTGSETLTVAIRNSSIPTSKP